MIDLVFHSLPLFSMLISPAFLFWAGFRAKKKEPLSQNGSRSNGIYGYMRSLTSQLLLNKDSIGTYRHTSIHTFNPGIRHITAHTHTLMKRCDPEHGSDLLSFKFIVPDDGVIISPITYYVNRLLDFFLRKFSGMKKPAIPHFPKARGMAGYYSVMPILQSNTHYFTFSLILAHS